MRAFIPAPLLFGVALATAGCGGPEASSTAPSMIAPSEDLSSAVDIEAPEVFALSGPGLWDGRASLGGVWVAHPSATEPERVIVRNVTNGRTTIGALFRRDGSRPGPALQVSMDAATDLGMPAGDPARLSVIALRREPLDPERGTAIVDFDRPRVITAEPPADLAVPSAATGLARPFVQIGIFTVQANADRTADALRAAGLPVRVLEQRSQDNAFSRVIVGPVATEFDRNAVLAKVRDLGFTDAYPVTN